MCNEYNGYTNYQTWNVQMWIDNDQGLYEYSREIAADLEKPSRIADWLKDYIEDMNPVNDQASMFTDIMGHALASVDWYEIAENLLEAE